MTTSTNQVAGEFIRYFEDLLGSSKSCDPIDLNVLSFGPCISLDQAAFLSSSISSEEIKSSLFSIGDEKASGPDGYSSCFFKPGLFWAGSSLRPFMNFSLRLPL